MGSRREFVLLSRDGRSIHFDNAEPVVEGDSLEEIADSLAPMIGGLDREGEDGPGGWL